MGHLQCFCSCQFSTLFWSLCSVRNLARKLHRLDFDSIRFLLDATGLLPCNGVIKYERPHNLITKIDFVFGIPKGFRNPRTLRQVLMDGDISFPLDQRFELAKQLARAVMYLHTAKFVHRRGGYGNHPTTSTRVESEAPTSRERLEVSEIMAYFVERTPLVRVEIFHAELTSTGPRFGGIARQLARHLLRGSAGHLLRDGLGD
jgi:hypothetical protein